MFAKKGIPKTQRQCAFIKSSLAEPMNGSNSTPSENVAFWHISNDVANYW